MGPEILGGAVLVIVALRLVGSERFRNQAKLPKVVFSLALLALGLAQGDRQVAVLIAVAVVGVAVMMFGIYYMFSSLFRTPRR